MEQPFPIEDLVDRVGNRYAIVVAVAKRACQLKEGAKPLVDIASKNPTTIALHEISAGFIQITDEVPEKAEEIKPDVIDQVVEDAAADDADDDDEDDDEDEDEDDDDDDDDEPDDDDDEPDDDDDEDDDDDDEDEK